MTIISWLQGGDLRSDGEADQVAQVVLDDMDLVVDVLSGLDHPEDVVRGRCADVLEKVARQYPDALLPHLKVIFKSLLEDPVPMVRFHLAMLLGHLVGSDTDHELLLRALLDCLEDESVFTVSWAIVSLCILARHDSSYMRMVGDALRSLSNHESTVVHAKVRHALPLLADTERKFPEGWIKSHHLQQLG